MTGKSIKSILTVPVSILGSIFVCSACATASSDDALLKNWAAKEEGFKNLVTMFGKQKTLIRVDLEGDSNAGFKSTPSGKPDLKEVAKIRELLKELNLIAIQRSEFSSDVSYDMIASSSGTFDEGESKGFVYTETKVPNLRSSLEGVSRKNTGMYHRPIKENWYLYLYISR